MKNSSTLGNLTRTLTTLSCLLAVSFSSSAEPPTGYYNNVDQSNAQTLRQSLHTIIDDHQRFPYTSSSTDTWDILEAADEDPGNPNNVIDVYRNASYTKQGGGNSYYNREHSWPKSYGFPSDGSSNYPYTDAHHLFISDSGYNSSRSNKPYANCSSACSEKPTEYNNNRGGSSSQSNWTGGSYSAGTWETWSGRRGDVARALMYMAVRYEGGNHGVTGYSEPDLLLTDDRNLIDQSNQGTNISVAYMGLKSVLLQWHSEDPVDDFERRRNDAIYAQQGNRNPFIDHPEYVDCVFQSVCSGSDGGGMGDTTAPSAPTYLSASAGSGYVTLTWNANSEADLAGYNVYRSTNSGTGYIRLNSNLVTTANFDDSSATAGTTYFYVVTAIDTSANESAYSGEVSAIAEGGNSAGSSVWINEIHYDNDGGDTSEFVEVAGTAGTDLSGWQLVAYNGNGGGAYHTESLVGTLPEQSNGFGTQSYAISGLQNGSPDGIALIDANGNVVQFLSYEGSFTATDGAAAGIASENIGVEESSSTPIGFSLQLTGTGSQYTDFSWQMPQPASAGSVNTEQVFVNPNAPADPVVWINEFHYDNDGSDSGEFIEVAGTAGVDLSGWSLVGYNGSNGRVYGAINLAGVIADQQNGFGTLASAFAGLQNGSPDGIALVDAQGQVVQFISYEGSIRAKDGAAKGLVSEDIGVSESASTAVGHSLQLSGSGVEYGDFTWQFPRQNTEGSVNSSQSFGY